MACFKVLCSMALLSAAASQLAPLQLWYNGDRQDNFCTATAKGQSAARTAGYTYVRDEAYVFATQVSGTIPLTAWYNGDRGDNFDTATAQGKADASGARYHYVRNEGYIYAQQVANTVALQLWYNDDRQDNFVTATPEGQASARSAGYKFVRIEGYVYRPAAFVNRLALAANDRATSQMDFIKFLGGATFIVFAVALVVGFRKQQVQVPTGYISLVPEGAA
jgi:hypothetical protein